MTPRIITREEIKLKLCDWADGRLSAEDIQSWAGSLYLMDDVDYSD